MTKNIIRSGEILFLNPGELIPRLQFQYVEGFAKEYNRRISIERSDDMATYIRTICYLKRKNFRNLMAAISRRCEEFVLSSSGLSVQNVIESAVVEAMTNFGEAKYVVFYDKYIHIISPDHLKIYNTYDDFGIPYAGVANFAKGTNLKINSVKSKINFEEWFKKQ